MELELEDEKFNKLSVRESSTLAGVLEDVEVAEGSFGVAVLLTDEAMDALEEEEDLGVGVAEAR